MNFDYSDDQKMLKDEARRFLAAKCDAKVVRGVLDHDDRAYDAALWKAVAEQGWLGTAIPEAYGGLGLGHVELCALAEELGRACAPIPFASTVYFVAEALMLFGSEAQKAKWLPRIATGEAIGAFATSERAGPVTQASLHTVATGGTLSGEKIPVTDGDVADLIVVLAKDGLYLVEKGAGVSAEVLRTLDPTRSAAKLVFDSAPAERLGGDDGIVAMQAVFDRAAVLLAFEQLGGADRCLEMAKDYALERFAFGRAIAGYQAIKHKLADIYVKNEIARSNAYYGAWALNTAAAELPLAAATARVAASEAFWFASKENIQTHGGIGFTWEADPQLYYRRSRQLSLVAGAPATWRERLVSQLEMRNAA
ncbi:MULTISPECIES: acyl-CoA dehydrogenase family protein [unclassified Sphingomonas]|uniref:acyl-CoA dehydrogenase family protein n=1 Tax=unclassified Sphingomonas TaxID=196159 RepID=UPI00092A88F7|nr:MULTISPECIES: acyl-CoA dehydrogenase family protein [unclassified Sphingomonas]MBN8849308.1 acyl-CoA/acyl-ACP dehydrogenase [Sphingomonas sp.]OJV34440.1 MAG: acyl-CoA dehydrogenase [Sphingomonas sp. 67-36]